jgi:hypothetical protein
MDGVLLMAGAMERERASSEKVSLNSLSLFCFDFYSHSYV